MPYQGLRSALRAHRMARLAFLVAVTASVSIPATASAQSQTDSRCPPEPEHPLSPAELRAGLGDTPQLLMKEPAPISIGFKQGRGEKDPERIIDLAGPGPERLPSAMRPADGGPLIVRWSTFLDAESGETFPDDQILAYASIDTEREQVAITVCVDPDRPTAALPGVYSGIVSLSDPRFAAVDIPVEITLQNQSFGLAWLSVIVGGLIGGFWGVAANILVTGGDAKKKTEDDTGQQQNTGEQEKNPSDAKASQGPPVRVLLLVALILGIAVGGVGTYATGYDGVPGFRGADLGEWLTLGAKAMSAATATYAIAVTATVVVMLVVRAVKRNA